MADTRAINSASPVNWGHPLNRGRVAWYLTMPGILGGSTLRDIANRNPVGVFTSMGNANNGYRPTTRPGGFGHVLYDGTAGYVNLGTPPALLITGDIGVFAWVYLTALPATNTQRVIVEHGYDGSKEGYTLRLNNTSGTTRLEFACYNGVSNIGVTGTGRIFTSADLNKWHRVGGTRNSAGWSTWYNGLLDTFTSSAVGPQISASVVTIGAAASSASFVNFWPGAIDDATFYNRAPSAAEVRTDYTLSQQGYSGVLNRVALMAFGSAAKLFRGIFTGGRLAPSGILSGGRL